MGDTMTHDAAIRKEAKPGDAIPKIQEFVHEALHYLTPGLPVPHVRVVDRTGVSWLGRCVWKPGEDNTELLLQRSITGDEETLKRIVMHEMCHHDEFLTKWAPMANSPRLNKLMAIEGHHGTYFMDKANRINSSLGADFVTKTSDEAMVVEDTTEFWVLLRRMLTGKISWAYAARPSSRQKAFVDELITSGTIEGQPPRVGPADYKLVKARDRFLALGAQIAKNFSMTTSPQMNERLEQLWEDSPAHSKVASAEPAMVYADATVTKIQACERLVAALPTWTLDLVGHDLMAVSPVNDDARDALQSLRSITRDLGLQVIVQTRQHRVVAIVDLSGLPTR